MRPSFFEPLQCYEPSAFHTIHSKEACEKYGVEGAKYYEDYNELLADSSIDIVHVCTPNVSHSPITVAAFEAGKNVLCEKPMAHNTDEQYRLRNLLTARYNLRNISHLQHRIFHRLLWHVLPYCHKEKRKKICQN
jgi:predicted dehydrogenase